MESFPITIRRSIEIIGLAVICIIIYTGKQIIMPLLVALLISILLVPIHRFLQKKRLPEILSIILSLLLLAIVLGGVCWFFSFHVGKVIEDFPKIKENVIGHLKTFSTWIGKKTHFSSQEQLKFINEKSDQWLGLTGSVLKGTSSSLTSVIIFVGLLPIYIFLILFYKDLLLRFIYSWFPENHHPKVKEIIYETESIIKSYLLGLLIQITYITILLGGLLWILGVKYAFLIGIIFALLNLIPYVGALIGNIIGALLTISSSQELWPVIKVIGTIALVQFLDNNILMPRIIGSRVKINSLAAIIGVLIGGALAGIPGMFISLPVIAVLKIIFDRTEIFKQWGILFGEDQSTDTKHHKKKKK
jgi:predicted PurR-regulated permease PerM